MAWSVSRSCASCSWMYVKTALLSSLVLPSVSDIDCGVALPTGLLRSRFDGDMYPCSTWGDMESGEVESEQLSLEVEAVDKAVRPEDTELCWFGDGIYDRGGTRGDGCRRCLW